jgi:hypothetical protein
MATQATKKATDVVESQMDTFDHQRQNDIQVS